MRSYPRCCIRPPCYFHQGTGSTKLRILHALSSPFVAKGDNGHWQFNYSSVGEDLASGALSNLYYPHSNRGAGLVFDNALITTGGRISNALAQEIHPSQIYDKGKESELTSVKQSEEVSFR